MKISDRLHSDRVWLYIFLFTVGIMVLHLFAHIISDSLPHTLKYLINPSNNTILSSLYTDRAMNETPNEADSLPVSYLIRNLGLRYSIYPIIVSMFLIEKLKLEKYLQHIHWKYLLLGIICFISLGLVASKAYIFTYTLTNFPLQIISQIRFEGSSAHVYVYSLVTWIILIVLSYKFLEKKMPKHVAFWITSLIFLSVEEVWEYANYLHMYIYPVVVREVFTPKIYDLTLYIWRATPTFLLFYYIRSWGFNKKVVNTWFGKMLIITFILSTILVFVPIFQIYFWLSLSLRILWSATYILLAYYIMTPPYLYSITQNKKVDK